jgi:hypothetical protein
VQEPGAGERTETGVAMEIREFVRDVLVDIVEGIKEAQRKDLVGGYIAPDAIGGHEFPADSGVHHSSRIISTAVKFDMAVTVETAHSGGGGAKVRIAVVEADLGGKLDSKNTQASRIQFSVPVLMPTNPRDWARESEDERKGAIRVMPGD